MPYSDRISVRLALFRPGSVLLDGTIIEPAKQLDPSFDGAGCLATVNWSVEPSQNRCIPEAPYVVCRSEGWPTLSEGGGGVLKPNPFTFDSGSRFRLGLDTIYGSPAPPWGFLICGFHVDEAVDIEFYGVDAVGAEIAGTRTRSNSGDEVVFIGPRIFAVKSTGDAIASNIVVFTATAEMIKQATLRLADVGPAFLPENKPGNWRYDNQSYLGRTGLDPLEALKFRMVADELARAQAGDPTSALLNSVVHRRLPSDIWTELRQSEVISQVAEHLDDIRRDPFWTFDAHVGADEQLQVSAGPMLQMLARIGPVEALSLGQGVTVPISSEDLTAVMVDAKGVYEFMLEKRRLPFPLIVVRGDFYDSKLGRVVNEFGIAGLELPSPSVVASAKQIASRGPDMLDGPAHADVKLSLETRWSSSTFFVATGDTDADILLLIGTRWPKPFVGVSLDPDGGNPKGCCSIRFGPVELPLTSDEILQPNLYPRDIFGRWSPVSKSECLLSPWPVASPGLLSLVFDYSSEVLSARVSFTWDRTLRRQADIRFGLRLLEVSLPDQADRLKTPLAPDDGVTCPAFGDKAELIVQFDADGNPSLSVANPPVGLSVRLEKTIEEPSPTGAGTIQASQQYEIVVPLGTAQELFAGVSDGSRLFVQVVADASEKVSGIRRTQPPLAMISQVVEDPRAPVILSEPWAIQWTSMPNGVTGEAKAVLTLPKFAPGPRPAGFYVWRAQETAILSYLLEWYFRDDEDNKSDIYLQTIRRERNMPARLALFQPLLESCLAELEFRNGFIKLFPTDNVVQVPTIAERTEIILPARQSGFEFVMFTAISNSGIETEKDPVSLLRILAVPDRPQAQRPLLKIIPSDDTGIFESSGLCLAIVSHDVPFEADSVRFFWDVGGEKLDPDELLFKLMPIAEMSKAEALRYISTIDEVLKNIPFPNTRFFLLRPNQNQTNDLHNFSIDIKVTNARTVLDEVPSRRSSIQSHFVGI